MEVVSAYAEVTDTRATTLIASKTLVFEVRFFMTFSFLASCATRIDGVFGGIARAKVRQGGVGKVWQILA
jgi:hypothetical protein